MKDLIFVVRNDGTYEQVPNRNLRAQENYSDNFVVIANQVGVVKAKIKLLSRTDKVEVKYLVPSLESVYDLIGDKPYFQDYANANVWRGAVPKKLLQEVPMSYAGQVEVSFSFTNSVLDSRALVKLGELSEGDLPESAENGEYYIIRYASYTKNDITWTYGQQAIWEDGWIKGGTYKVIGTTTTHRLNVEQSLKGEQAEFDTENEDEYLDTLQDHSGRINTLENTANDHELRISTNETDIDDIESGETVVGKAYGDEYGNRISTTYATQNTLDDVVNQIENTGEIIAKKAEYAEKDESGRVIEDTYLSAFNYIYTNKGSDVIGIELGIKRPNGSTSNEWIDIDAATTTLAGVMSASDKVRLDELWAILQNSDNPNFVDTINEILHIFSNYPEGMDIIEKFATKVDKTTKVNGKDLTGDVTLAAKDIKIDTCGGARDGQSVEYAILDIDDNKANKVVGGVFNGMDLKAAAEKLNTDKQDVIADSGWLTASLTVFYEGELKYRKIDNVVYIRGVVKCLQAGVLNIADIAIGYRPSTTISKMIVANSNVELEWDTTREALPLRIRNDGFLHPYPLSGSIENKYVLIDISYVI